jgi:RNA polymerase sigma-70 factor (ECF subfamily)
VTIAVTIRPNGAAGCGVALIGQIVVAPAARPVTAHVTRFSGSFEVENVRRDLASASDAELLRAGDPDAFAVVYDRHVARVHAWARARVGEHAADLTAEVFARAWLSRSRFRDQDGAPALPWLLGIAQNVLRDSLRKRRVEDAARRRLGLPSPIAPGGELEAVDERLSLPDAARAAVRSLPDRDRELLRLRVIEERPYREIAADLSCTPQAARLRVSRLLRQLRCSLGGHRP